MLRSPHSVRAPDPPRLPGPERAPLRGDPGGGGARKVSGSEGLRSAPGRPLPPAHPRAHRLRAAPGARPPYRELSGPEPARTSAAPAPDAWAPRQRRQTCRASLRHVPGRARRCSRLSTHLGPARPLPPAPLPLRPRSRRRRRLLFAERGLPGPSGYGRRRRSLAAAAATCALPERPPRSHWPPPVGCGRVALWES